MLGNRYELIEPLGSGGMAVVWQAHDQVLGRTVAVKLLAGKHAADPQSRKLIRAEAQAAAMLSHPNIAQVYDYGESDEGGECQPYVVMEYVRGTTLEQRMAAGPLSPRFAMRVCAEVSAALAAAHTDGLVHRDIKPANVMVTPSGAKVVDFGIAAATSGAATQGQGFEVLGTPAYLAPERLVSDAVQPASDVYAIGVLLYRLLSGHSPWSADTTTQMLTAHVYIEPQPLPQLPDVPDYVTVLCNRSLSKDPTLRPSAREAAALLAQGAGLPVVQDEPAARPAALVADAGPSLLIRREPGNAAVDKPEIAGRPPGAASLDEHASAAAVEPAGARKAVPFRRLLGGAVVLIAAGVLLWLLVPGLGGGRGRESMAGPPTVSTTAPGSGAPGSGAPGSGAPGSGVPVPGAPGPAVRGSGPPAVSVNAMPAARPPAGTRRTTPAGGAVATSPPARVGSTATSRRTRSAPQTTAPSPPAEPRTLSSSAGSVVATCPSATVAQLLSWTATKPYKVNQASPGPASAAVIEFKHGNRRTRMTVTCSAGVPSTSNEES